MQSWFQVASFKMSIYILSGHYQSPNGLKANAFLGMFDSTTQLICRTIEATSLKDNLFNNCLVR